ncbi:hypothetical protein [Methanosphaera sp. BMS]|uniref:hypothetical protein n=1 Tax=Methanosphaera sp. BMS TaxID=1789762 RepID=UPI000DC1D679|nr:hypothetical protein [Methanosphaera sp. BMS]AWX32146.1 hypothetical protein AW729_03100 [Methanosphaera sp. BMS]
MNDKTKIILLLIIFLMIIVLGFINIGLISSNNSQSEFNRTVSQASSIENISDMEFAKYYNKSITTSDESIDVFKNKTNYINEEILILQSFDDKSGNDTLKDYVNLEIKRLTSEKEAFDYLVRDMENYNRYKNKSITKDYALGVSNQNTMELERISNNTFGIKSECEYYLNMHPDIKEVLVNLNVDDDFYANNIQYSNITRII